MAGAGSSARNEAVATLRAVTGVATDAEAARLLDSAGGDLERAAAAFLDRASAPEPAELPVARPPRRRTPGMPRWLDVLFSPLRVFWSVVSGLGDFLMRFLGGPARAIAAAPGDTGNRRFLAYFEDLYGREHPDFFDGTYMAALAAAQQQLKFLLVYLHSDSHRQTEMFCRNVLANRGFIDAANASFVVWAGSITQPNAAAAQHALRVSGFPYLGIVSAPRTTVRVDARLPSISPANFGHVLSSRAGPPAVASGVDSVLSWMERVLQRYTPMLDAARATRTDRESARLLREQQDEEYAAALEADRARERAAAEAAEHEEKEKQRVEERELRRERKREALGAEPDKAPGIASVMLRLPDGSRVGRRFPKDHALECVFDWAEVNSVDIEVACLVTSFPRKSFRYPEDGEMSIEAAGLFPSAMLMLEERLDDDE